MSQCEGLTLIEALIVVAVLTLLIALLLPAIARGRPRAARVNCINHLKQVGLSFREWALDNNDEFPMAVSITRTGAMEWAQQGIAWPVFQVMSNELNTPKILICPAEQSRTNAPSFDRNLNSWELSYFVGLHAKETEPQMWLTGDSNLEIDHTAAGSGIATLTTNRSVRWSSTRHAYGGNVGLADGSVQGFSSTRLRASLGHTSNGTNQIILP